MSHLYFLCVHTSLKASLYTKEKKNNRSEKWGIPSYITRKLCIPTSYHVTQNTEPYIIIALHDGKTQWITVGGWHFRLGLLINIILC